MFLSYNLKFMCKKGKLKLKNSMNCSEVHTEIFLQLRWSSTSRLLGTEL